VILFIEIMMHYLLPHPVAPTASLPVALRAYLTHQVAFRSFAFAQTQLSSHV
jgi:hypothetical protein